MSAVRSADVADEEYGVQLMDSALQGLEDKGYQKMNTATRPRSNTATEPMLGSDKEPGISILSILQGVTDFSTLRSKKFINQEIDYENWEYPGWGSVYEKKFDNYMLPAKEIKPQLDVYRSTAIAGNALLASVLYTTGICCTACGQLAPFAMLLCCIALYPYRKIFQECGTALPLNGGVYVLMLNSTSKLMATIAASCSLISYSATAVVSAASATSYAYGEFGAFPMLPVTVGVLAIFGILVFFGVKDSANVATGIIIFHLITLVIVVIASFKEIIRNEGKIWHSNWYYDFQGSATGGRGMDLYLGYSVGLLGLTGFETSANYIEAAGPFETNKPNVIRKQSVFEHAINSMWWMVIIINPLIALSTLGVVPLGTILNNVPNILAVVGLNAGGPWLQTLVAVDALCVLSGGVLTAYVGVTGLIKQLASDRCLPVILLQQHSYTNQYHYILLTFFLLCSTLYLITEGDIVILSGVFSVAFLMVLVSFATANILLKIRRPRLPRGVTSSWFNVLIGWIAMFLGLIGNVLFKLDIIQYFVFYLFFYFTVIVVTFERIKIIQGILYIVNQFPRLKRNLSPYLYQQLVHIRKHTVVFFAKTSELHILNKAILYARDNELCDRLIIIHVIVTNPAVSGVRTRDETISRASSSLQLMSMDDHTIMKQPMISARQRLALNDSIMKSTTNNNNNNNNNNEKETRDQSQKASLTVLDYNDPKILSKSPFTHSTIRVLDHSTPRRHSHDDVYIKDTITSPRTATTAEMYAYSPSTPKSKKSIVPPKSTSKLNNEVTSQNDNLHTKLYSRSLDMNDEFSINRNNNNNNNTISTTSKNQSYLSSDSSFIKQSPISHSIHSYSEEHEHEQVDIHESNHHHHHMENCSHTSTTYMTISQQNTIDQLRENLQVLDHVYPKVKIDLLLVTAEEFNPPLVAKLSEDLDIKPAFMFIRCPGEVFKYHIGEFDGVRTIMR